MNEKDIFIAALEVEEGPQRSAFLAEACAGDMALLQRLDALLGEHRMVTTRVPDPALNEGKQGARDADNWLGTEIGPYKLLEQIGEGGFGLVFMAEQKQPVRRQVAVKVLKPGMDSRQVVARFEAERQALALMNHPNIARILEAGATPSQPGTRGGLPYVVMELVRGSPITDYCTTHHLTPRERLELFVTVCQAVQHAHQKGIIHRDIKPSNVMVTQQDGKPVVKVIDFGIAKALEQRLTEKTVFTGSGVMIGTPMYMSPEQFDGGPDIDTRTDVYSLGLLLYELLTGTTPFDTQRLREAGWDELRRIIREEDPVTPSARVSTLAADKVPTQGKSDPKRLAQLGQLLRGELDWIVMKAIEKDRTRRYETASGLAADVARYLRNEPVEACPPSTWYRLSKMAGRNRAMLTTAAFVALVLVAGTVVSVWQALRATSERDAKERTLIALGDADLLTRQQLQRAERAEVKTRRELFDSLVAAARANRRSRQIGQRFGTLAILRKATAIARELQLPAEHTLELRKESLAAMALTDLGVAGEWDDDLPGGQLAFAPGLKYYARSDLKSNVVVRRVGDGVELCRLRGPAGGENWLGFSPDSRLLAVVNPSLGRAQVWRLTSSDIPENSDGVVVREPAKVLETAWRSGCCFSPDSREFAVQQPPLLAVACFDLATGKTTGTLSAVGKPCHLAFNPKGRQMALGFSGTAAEVRDLEADRLVWRKPLSGGISSIQWYPDGKTLAVCQSIANGDVISLWDGASGEHLGNLDGLHTPGTRCIFNRAGTLMASNGWENTLRLWDPFTGRQLFSTFSVPGSAGLVFSPNDRLLAGEEFDRKLRIWEVSAGEEYRTLTALPINSKISFDTCDISADGRLLAGSGPDFVGVWDLTSGRKLAAIDSAGGTNHVLFEPSGSLLIMGDTGLFRRLIQRDRQTGLLDIGPPMKLLGSGNGLEFAHSADGRVIASAQFNAGAVVLHVDQPDQPIRVGPHADVRFVAVSPDGQWLATGGYSSLGAKVWKWKDQPGKPAKDLPVGGQCRVLFSPDGKYLVTSGSSSYPQQIRFWEVGTWAEVILNEPIRGSHPAFSPDGKLLVVENGAGVAVLLDSRTGHEVAHLEDPNQHRANQFAFSPDGSKLVSATRDGRSLHIWDLQALRRQLAEMGLDWENPS